MLFSKKIAFAADITGESVFKQNFFDRIPDCNLDCIVLLGSRCRLHLAHASQSVPRYLLHPSPEVVAPDHELKYASHSPLLLCEA